MATVHKAHLPGFIERQANKMEHLRRETGASVMLSVYEGGSVITLDQVESREGLRIVSDIGSRLPVFCTSQGKVFLAHMSRAGAENLLRSQSLTQFTPHTITDSPSLLREVEVCRTQGYAIENGEYKIGLRSISAPIYNVGGKCSTPWGSSVCCAVHTPMNFARRCSGSALRRP